MRQLNKTCDYQFSSVARAGEPGNAGLIRIERNFPAFERAGTV